MRAEIRRAAGRGLQASGVIGRLAGGHRGDGGFVCGGWRSGGRPVSGLRHNLAHPLEPPLGAMGTFPMQRAAGQPSPKPMCSWWFIQRNLPFCLGPCAGKPPGTGRNTRCARGLARVRQPAPGQATMRLCKTLISCGNIA